MYFEVVQVVGHKRTRSGRAGKRGLGKKFPTRRPETCLADRDRDAG